MNITLSQKFYFLLVLILAIFTAINVFLPQGEFAAISNEQQFPASKPVLAIANALIMLIFYGGLGYLGYHLSQKINFPDIWDNHVSNYQRFIVPLVIGCACGVFFIIADLIFSQIHNLGALPHPPFPTSIVASLVAGIGEEIIFRLFFISFWVWLFSKVLFKNRWQHQTFWVVSIFSALAFAGGHLPSVMIITGFKTIAAMPPALLVEIFLLNGVISLLAAYYFRKFGFLAAVGIHFWTDIVWHVIWGVI